MKYRNNRIKKVKFSSSCQIYNVNLGRKTLILLSFSLSSATIFIHQVLIECGWRIHAFKFGDSKIDAGTLAGLIISLVSGIITYRQMQFSTAESAEERQQKEVDEAKDMIEGLRNSLDIKLDNIKSEIRAGQLAINDSRVELEKHSILEIHPGAAVKLQSVEQRLCQVEAAIRLLGHYDEHNFRLQRLERRETVG